MLLPAAPRSTLWDQLLWRFLKSVLARITVL
jgi:hypothetical protein